MTAPARGLDPRRAVQVITTFAPDLGIRGSGYRLAWDLVLTAEHILRDATSVKVRIIADDGAAVDMDAQVGWSDEAIDVAVLRLSVGAPVGDAPADAMPPVRFGQVTGIVGWEAVGFPWFKLGAHARPPSTNTYRDTHHAHGTTAPWSNLRRGSLEITATAPPPERNDGSGLSPWEGMSGSAVFADGYLIGVVTEHSHRDGPGRLSASRIERWYKHLPPDRVLQLNRLIGLPVNSAHLVEIGALGGLAPTHVIATSLPRDTSAFTGRFSELGRLTGSLAHEAASGQVLSIHTVDGMAGVGKTAFAVHAAHLMAGQFRDGQLFMPLHAHTRGVSPVDPADALATLLLGDGVAPGQIPKDLHDRADLWRSRTAGKQIILVLDDAASSEQVRPLLPSAPGTLVLITSRRRLTGLDDITPLSLGILPSEEATALFTRIAARPELDPADESVTRLAELCGYLPLAIRMVAARLPHHPAWSPDDLIDEFTAITGRLAVLHDEDVSVSTAFDLSYRDLDPDERRLFRRIGGHPGTETDRYAAAALINGTPTAAGNLLKSLENHHMIDEPIRGRYRMHDLAREYALTTAENLEPDNLREAVERLLDYYQATSGQADGYLTRYPRSVPTPPAPPTGAGPEIAVHDQALTWIRTERPNLLAAIDNSRQRGRFARVVAMTANIASLLRDDGPWTKAIELHAAAVAAAQQLNDLSGEAAARNELGRIQRFTGDISGAIHTLEQSLDTFQGLGDLLGEAAALDNLGMTLERTGDYAEAMRTVDRALTIYRGLGNRLGEATALCDLGMLKVITGDYSGGIHDLEPALKFFQELDNRVGEVTAWGNLGLAREQIGDYAGAVRAQEQALTVARSLGHRFGEATALGNLGVLRQIAGDYPGAVQALEHALSLYQDLGHQFGEAGTLNNLGATLRLAGDYPGSNQRHEQALRIHRNLGHRSGEANALGNLGIVRRLVGDLPGAAQALDEALDIFRDLGNLLGEAEVFNHRGALHRMSGNVEVAMADHQHALTLAHELHSLAEEARALEGIAECHLLRGEADESAALFRQAIGIYQELGMPDAERLAARLTELGC